MSCIRVKVVNPQENGKNYSGSKEIVAAYSLIAKRGRELYEAVTVRVYMGRSSGASTVYATVWIRGNKNALFISGSGSAGGQGYCKESTAIAEALDSAGIELYGDPYGRVQSKKRMYFGGTGLSRLHDILDAIAKKQGFNINGSILIEH